ncbi:MAG: ATP-binding cassette domain-containing protein [Clostridiales bacterium]|nr:ATP-binding cassette domain-containing protein [Clostridiales bacterium]
MQQSLSLTILFVTCCLLASKSLIKGEYIAAAALAVSAFFEAGTPVFSGWGRVERTSAAAANLFNKDFSYQTEPIPSASAISSESIQTHPDSLRISNISFSYPYRLPLIENLSFEIRKGSLTLLTGPSGSGKSTLVDLILGFKSVQSGSVLLGEIDQKDEDPYEWRKHFSFADQKPYFFNSTVRENLKLANQAANDDDMLNALERAAIPLNSGCFPKGLDSIVKEGGSNFSSGELQRLSIARAILSKAPFLLLDEPAANLDALAEKKVYELLDDLRKEKGILLISHKPEIAFDLLIKIG